MLIQNTLLNLDFTYIFRRFRWMIIFGALFIWARTFLITASKFILLCFSSFSWSFTPWLLFTLCVIFFYSLDKFLNVIISFVCARQIAWRTNFAVCIAYIWEFFIFYICFSRSFGASGEINFAIYIILLIWFFFH